MHSGLQETESAEVQVRVKHVSYNIIYEFRRNLFMLFLTEELMKGISENMINHHTDTKQLHGHVKGCINLLTSIFIIKVSHYLCYLN